MKHSRDEKGSTPPQHSTVVDPGKVISDPLSIDSAQTKSALRTWEGEGGAVAQCLPESTEAPVVTAPAIVSSAAGERIEYVMTTRTLRLPTSRRDAERVPVNRPRLRPTRGRGSPH